MTGPDIIPELITGENWPTHDEARSTATVYGRLTAEGLERMPKPHNVSNPTPEHYAAYAAAHGYKRLVYSSILSALHRSRWAEQGDAIVETAEPYGLLEARAFAAGVVADFAAPVAYEPTILRATTVEGQQVGIIYMVVPGVGVIPVDSDKAIILDADNNRIAKPSAAHKLALEQAIRDYVKAMKDENKAAVDAIAACTTVQAVNTQMVTYCRKAPHECKKNILTEPQFLV